MIFIKNVLRIRYKNDDIGKDDSFLDFQQQLIEPLLTQPYRENVDQTMTITENGDDTFSVIDQVMYQIRTNNNQISEVAKFDYSNEIVKKENIKIYLRKYYEEEKEIDINDENKVKLECNSIGDSIKSIDLNLKEYITCDKLQIRCVSQYKIKKDTINVWQMSFLTKNLKMSISAPNGYNVNFESFSLNDKFELVSRENGKLTYNYNYWVLPHSGFAWKLIKI